LRSVKFNNTYIGGKLYMANETRLMSGSLRLAQLDGAFSGEDNTSAIYHNTDGKLYWKVASGEAQKFVSDGDVSGSIAAAVAALTASIQNVDQESQDADASLTTRIASEETARASVDTVLAAADSSIETRLSDEEDARAAADTSLTTRVSNEEVARASVDTVLAAADSSIETRLSDEEDARAAADTSLTTRLSNEEDARASVDTVLAAADASIAAGLSTELVDRAAADSSLTTRLSNEEDARASVDTVLAAADSSIETRLSTEEDARASVDALKANLAGGNNFTGDQTIHQDYFVKAGSFVTYSDATLKTNIQTMDDALDKVMSMRGVTYNFKSREDIQEVGFLAQEMRQSVPEVVYGNGDGNLGIDYAKLTSVLVEAVKAQQVQIEELKELLKK
jgi:cation diffusion facilitator CzcD-associated flavoprotein CzcO